MVQGPVQNLVSPTLAGLSLTHLQYDLVVLGPFPRIQPMSYRSPTVKEDPLPKACTVPQQLPTCLMLMEMEGKKRRETLGSREAPG